MKIAAYEVRPDEKPVIEGLCKKYGIELISTPANLDKTTAHMAAGCDGVTTLGQSDYSNAVLDELKGYGVQVLASRCVGYNHMNCDYARSLGFRLCNGAYAPNGVAEYTVMAILMCIRKFKKALYNTNDNDFTLKGKMGRELRTMTVGVMGTGKIGFTIIKCLSGFGCRIIANDVYENDAVRAYAEYVDLDTLYRESDIITIHTPAAAGDHRHDRPRGHRQDEGRCGIHRQCPGRADGYRRRHRGSGVRQVRRAVHGCLPRRDRHHPRSPR